MAVRFCDADCFPVERNSATHFGLLIQKTRIWAFPFPSGEASNTPGKLRSWAFGIFFCSLLVETDECLSIHLSHEAKSKFVGDLG
jgi:hypothetical protein